MAGGRCLQRCGSLGWFVVEAGPTERTAEAALDELPSCGPSNKEDGVAGGEGGDGLEHLAAGCRTGAAIRRAECEPAGEAKDRA